MRCWHENCAVALKSFMKHIFLGAGLCVLMAGMSACGAGDTGEGYNSNKPSDFNTDPNVTFTDSAATAEAGDRGNPDSSINVPPSGPNTGPDTGTTNVNRSSGR